MHDFNLTTWSGDQLVAYEPITAMSGGDAVAFFKGMLTERTKTQREFLARLGVHYRVEYGRRRLEDLNAAAGQAIGSFHFTEYADGAEMHFRSFPEG